MSDAGAQIALAPLEGRALAAHLDRLHSWDSQALVRLVSRRTALGIYGAPPMGVMSFVALPLKEPATVELDVTLPAVMARAALVDGETASLDGVSAPAELSFLPPADGWHLPIQGVAGDLIPMVEESVAEFRARSAAVLDTQVLADQLWDRPSFGGLPMRMLHAAHRLGFIVDDGSRVSACTVSGWKRLTTVRGQVFIRTIPPGQRALRIIT